MNKTAILHIPESQYSFAYGEHELRIRLRAAREGKFPFPHKLNIKP